MMCRCSAVTLWSKNPQLGRAELQAAANLLEEQLQQVPGSRDIYTIGRQAEQVSVRLDPARLGAYQLSLPQLSQALQQAGTVRSSQAMLAPQQLVQLESGSFLTSADEVAQLVVAVRSGTQGELLPVYLRDVADISRGVAEPDTYVQHLQPIGADGSALSSAAVTVVVAKQPGFNAVDVTQALLQQKLDPAAAELFKSGY